MRRTIRSLVSDDAGQDIVEYALLLGFVALVCVVAITSLGISVDSAIDGADTQLRSDAGI